MTTQPEALRLALEAGGRMYSSDEVEFFLPDLARFAALVAAAEREACAKVCEEVGDRDADTHAYDCVEAIRARSET